MIRDYRCKHLKSWCKNYLDIESKIFLVKFSDLFSESPFD